MKKILIYLFVLSFVLSAAACSGEAPEPIVPVSTTPQSTTPQSTTPQITVPGGVSFDTPHEYDTPFISSDLLVELKTKYYEWKTGEGEKIDPEDVFVWRYYGVYGDCHMVKLVHKQNDRVSELEERLNEYRFAYEYSIPIYAYKDGTFYTLKEAYFTEKLFSKAELAEFGEAIGWGSGYGYLTPVPEELLPSESQTDPYYISLPNEVDTPYIDQALALQIKSEFYKRRMQEGETWEKNDVYVYDDFGTYGQCRVVHLEVVKPYTDIVKFEQAGGYYFCYATDHFAVAFSDGVLYSLNEAYEAGLISRSELYRLGVEHGGSSFTESYPNPPTEE